MNEWEGERRGGGGGRTLREVEEADKKAEVGCHCITRPTRNYRHVIGVLSLGRGITVV